MRKNTHRDDKIFSKGLVLILITVRKCSYHDEKIFE